MNTALDTRKILNYSDVSKIAPGDSNEELVSVQKFDPSIALEYAKLDMLEYTGDVMFVRDIIAKKLAIINNKLASNDYLLKITYGYRHPNVQRSYFNKRRDELKAQNINSNDKELDEITHKFVAVPDIAGHPAGAAVDLTIIDINNNEIDMGNIIADYTDSEKIQTFSKNITKNQLSNRLLLHDLMIEQDFAPFYGEWWHFSYGDREWAAFYNKKARYGAIEYTI